MNERALAQALFPDEELDQAMEYLAQIEPQERERYERLLGLADQIRDGDQPANVIICRRRGW